MFHVCVLAMERDTAMELNMVGQRLCVTFCFVWVAFRSAAFHRFDSELYVTFPDSLRTWQHTWIMHTTAYHVNIYDYSYLNYILTVTFGSEVRLWVPTVYIIHCEIVNYKLCVIFRLSFLTTAFMPKYDVKDIRDLTILS